MGWRQWKSIGQQLEMRQATGDTKSATCLQSEVSRGERVLEGNPPPVGGPPAACKPHQTQQFTPSSAVMHTVNTPPVVCTLPAQRHQTHIWGAACLPWR